MIYFFIFLIKIAHLYNFVPFIYIYIYLISEYRFLVLYPKTDFLIASMNSSV